MLKRDFLKLGVTTAIAAPFASEAAKSQDDDDPITVRWLGGAAMEIRVGELLFLTDPCFGQGPRAFLMPDPNAQFDPAQGPAVRAHARLTGLPDLSAFRYDAVLLSHAHEDHFDESARNWLARRMPVFCPGHDVPDLIAGGFDARPMRHLTTHVFERGASRLSLTAVPASHSPNPDVARMLGEGNGYFLQASVRGKSRNVYWSGDTFLTDEIAGVLSGLPVPDLFIPHVGAVGRDGSLGQLSMSGQDAVDGAQRLGVRQMLPVHHSTFSLYREPVEAVIRSHARVFDWFDLTVLEVGGTLQL